LRYLAGVLGSWWGSHPTLILQIYKSIIRSKIEYGCFLFGSVASSNKKKLNSLQTSCLRTVLEALKSTPSLALNVEAACPPLHIRYRWLAGKFLLKCASSSSSRIIDLFRSVHSNWRFVHKFLPLLSSIIQSLSSALKFVISSDKLPLYNTPYPALIFSPSISICSNFLSYKPKELRLLPPHIVNNLFCQYIMDNHSYSTLVYTDSSVTSVSAGYAYHIPNLLLKSSGNLPTAVSSFTAECYAILEAIKATSSLPSGHFLIISDSQSCLQALTNNPFLSKSSHLILRI